jgi:hypothetical protein
MRSTTSTLLTALVTLAFAFGDVAVTSAQPRGRGPVSSVTPPRPPPRLPGTGARAQGLPFSPRSVRVQDPRLGLPRPPRAPAPRHPTALAGFHARHAELVYRAARLKEFENVEILFKSAAVSGVVGGAIALVAGSAAIATVALFVAGLTAAVIPMAALATWVDLAITTAERDRLGRELAELERIWPNPAP